MKRILINIVVLFLVFVVSAGGTGLLMNQEKVVRVHNVDDASLPVMYMEMADMLVNPMFGYANEMEPQYVRDGLTLLPTNRVLTMVLEKLGNKVDSVEYVVATADGTQTVEKGIVTGLKDKDGYLTAEFKIQNPILMNQEYTLRFDVTLDDGDVYHYYTRLLQRAGTNLEEYLKYVDMFYQSCLDPVKAYDLMTYLEPKTSAPNDTYNKLDIHSRFEKISWSNMEVSLVQKAYPVIKDMNGTTCSIVMKYIISDKVDENHLDYYNVTDFYRMRYSQARIMLLDFERETQEIFSSSNVELTSTGINLGITDHNVEFRSNGNIVAFVQEGELWSYSRSTGKLIRVFSFRSGEMDVRENLQEHDIKIVRVGETGDIDFVVYGYMNCDEHQGEVGVGVYHYSEDLNQIQEQIFIPISTSYEYLENNMGILSYVTMDNLLYLMMENSLYQIDIEKKTFSIVKENFVQDCYVISPSQQHIAWMDEMSYDASNSLTIMNLELGESYQIFAGEGAKIRALGFINEDFVYGIANDADITYTETGETIFAMHTVRIEQFGGNLMKESCEDGTWITGVNLEPGLLELVRVKLQDGVYVPDKSDYIMNNLQNVTEKVEIRQISGERKAAQMVLQFQKTLASDKVLYLEANMVNIDKQETMELGQERQDDEVYYVYGSGKLDSTWSDVRDAILRADNLAGIVLNRQQQYVWERGNKDTSYRNDLVDVPDAALSGTLDEHMLGQLMGERYMVFDLTGCTLDSVLYLVNRGYPVTAKVSDEVTVVIIGYNTYNTILYYPETGESGYYGIKDSTKMFAEAGNVFVGYMEKLGEATKVQ